jgi:hypothetical protein
MKKKYISISDRNNEFLSLASTLTGENHRLREALLDFIYAAEHGHYIERAGPQVYRAKKALKVKL